MITLKLFGGAKKTFSTEKLQNDKSDISIQEIIDKTLIFQILN